MGLGLFGSFGDSANLMTVNKFSRLYFADGIITASRALQWGATRSFYTTVEIGLAMQEEYKNNNKWAIIAVERYTMYWQTCPFWN